MVDGRDLAAAETLESVPTPPAVQQPQRLRDVIVQYVVEHVFLLIFGVLFALGLALTALYSYVKFRYGHSIAGFVGDVLIVVLVCLLYFAEGAEIAVTRILDRADDQIPETMHALVEQLRERLDDFLTGRQLAVVLMVLGIGFICEWLYISSVDLANNDEKLIPRTIEYTLNLAFSPVIRPGLPAPPTPVLPPGLRSFLLIPAEKAYAYLFPAFAVLLFAQLYSKFVIHRRPQRFFNAYWTQAVIWGSVPAGKLVRLGLPQWLIDAVVRKQVENEVGASRLQLYKGQATFRCGIGVEMARVVVTIDPSDGSTNVEQDYAVKAFADGPNEMRHEETWDAPFVSAPEVDIRNLPAHCGKYWKSETKFNDTHTTAKFEYGFAMPLQAGDTYGANIKYDLGAHSSKIGNEEWDFFSYLVGNYPTKVFELTVSVKNGGKEPPPIVLTEARIFVNHVSHDDKMNAREARRHEANIKGQGSDSIVFTIDCPLLPAEYLCKWRVRARRKTKRIVSAKEISERIIRRSEPPAQREEATRPRDLLSELGAAAAVGTIVFAGLLLLVRIIRRRR